MRDEEVRKVELGRRNAELKKGGGTGERAIGRWGEWETRREGDGIVEKKEGEKLGR